MIDRFNIEKELHCYSDDRKRENDNCTKSGKDFLFSVFTSKIHSRRIRFGRNTELHLGTNFVVKR